MKAKGSELTCARVASLTVDGRWVVRAIEKLYIYCKFDSMVQSSLNTHQRVARRWQRWGRIQSSQTRRDRWHPHRQVYTSDLSRAGFRQYIQQTSRECPFSLKEGSASRRCALCPKSILKQKSRFQAWMTLTHDRRWLVQISLREARQLTCRHFSFKVGRVYDGCCEEALDAT